MRATASGRHVVNPSMTAAPRNRAVLAWTRVLLPSWAEVAVQHGTRTALSVCVEDRIGQYEFIGRFV